MRSERKAVRARGGTALADWVLPSRASGPAVGTRDLTIRGNLGAAGVTGGARP
jgi:hypothetical protein